MRNRAGLLRVVLLILAVFLPVIEASSQQDPIPNFWDPNVRSSPPDVSKIGRLRFLTTTDFPPFNFIDRKKRLTGFHVDLARAICEELNILRKCQIQALPWQEIEEALKTGKGEAIIAGLEIDRETRSQYAFTRSYLHIPARFASRRSDPLSEPLPDGLRRKTIGVVRGSAQAQYFGEVFAGTASKPFDTAAGALKALQAGEVDGVFADALSVSFWLASRAAADCCRFSGGPYLSRHHFGHGLAIAVDRQNTELVRALDFALRRISEKGKFGELYLRYFPLGLF